MPRTKLQRAQQFQPYDALRGFNDLLRQQERIIIPKKELSEDDYEELNDKASQLQVGKMVSIIHYESNEYVQTTGILSSLDVEKKILQVVKTRIHLKDIVHIDIL